MQEDTQNKAGTAVLFIHGFMGSPKQFNYLLPVAESFGCDAYALLLPGHGGTFDEFAKTGLAQWERHVQANIDDVRGKYKAILLVGHSMGGLLAIESAVQDSRGIRGILAIALPLYLRVSFKGMQTNWRYAARRMERRDQYTEAAADSCGVGGVSVWNAAGILPRAGDVLRLCAKTRAMLGRLSVPLTIVHSPKDEWVSRLTLRAAHRRLPSAGIVVLKESGHFWYAEEDKKEIGDMLARLLDK